MFDKSGLLECTGIPYESMLPRIFVTPKSSQGPATELAGAKSQAFSVTSEEDVKD